MRRTAVTAACLLAACGGGEDASDRTRKGEGTPAARSAAAAAAPVRIEPGRWTTTVDIVSVEMPGMPREIAERVRGAMKGAGAGAQRLSYCVTPAEAAKPPPEIFAGQERNKCRANRFRMEGGRMTGELDCEAPGGQGRTLLKLDGTFTPRSYAMTIEADARASEMPGGRMTTTVRTRGERIGACAS